MKKILFLIMISQLNFIFSDDISTKVSSSFPWLSKIGNEPQALIFFDKNISYINTDYLEKSYDEQYVGEIKYSQNEEAIKVTTFTGPNGDPRVSITYIYQNTEYTQMFYTAALIIPGTGNIYSFTNKHLYFGSTGNHLFIDKYVFSNGKFIQVEQPIYYLNFPSISKIEIVLHEDFDMNNIVGVIPKNSEILIIGMKTSGKYNYFLLKTKFGLVGWYRFESNNDALNTSLQSVFFSTD